jgi:hypothetical protein
MPVPTFHINISGNVVAAYGAVLATITGAVQMANFLRDRRLVKVRVQHDMEMIGDPRYANVTLTIVTVINAGRRPVTITGVSAYRLFPLKPFVFTDTRPALPYELTEGKQLLALGDLKTIDLTTIEHWEAYDALGNTYRLFVAPWHKRWISRWRRKRAWRNPSAAQET